MSEKVSTKKSRRRSETEERLCWFWEDGMISHITRALGVCCTLTMLVYAQAAFSEEVKDYGKPGSPIELVVGYQPYYTESWSGVIMRSKKFYEKYLPAGSKVDFQIGLQGAIIVNGMLA